MPWGNPIVGGGGALIRDSIHSENYVAGVSGWTIERDGFVEFSAGVFRGELFIQDANGSYVDILADAFSATILMNPPNSPPYTFSSGFVDVSSSSDFSYITIQSPVAVGQTAATITVGSSNAATASPSNAFVNIGADLRVDGIGNKQFIDLSTLTVTNSTALQIIPASAQLQVAADSVYWIETLISYDGPTAADARFAWLASSPSLTMSRYIDAPDAGMTTNIATLKTAIVRAIATNQIVGTPNGTANAFTVYKETGILRNTTNNPEQITMQFAQGTANVTPSVVQSGVIRAERVA